MAITEDLSKEDFLNMARMVGLDTSDTAHMDELYPFVRASLRSLVPLNDIDVSEAEPETVYLPER